MLTSIAGAGACSFTLDLGAPPAPQDADDVTIDADLDANLDADLDADPDAEVSGDCPLPYLLVATEEFEGGPGTILRLSLDEAHRFEPCDPLTGSGAIPSRPLAVAWVGEVLDVDHGVAIASPEGVHLLDAELDEVLWSAERLDEALVPADLFRLDDSAASPRIVVAQRYPRDDVIQELHLYDPATDELEVQTRGWLTLSFTRSPLDPSRPLGLVIDGIFSYAAAEMSSLDGTIYRPPYANFPEGGDLRTLYSVTLGGLRRSVWVGGHVEDEADVIYYVNDGEGTEGNDLRGPTACGGPPRRFLHAVPDPIGSTSFLAIFQTGEGALRSVVSLSALEPDAGCQVVVDPPPRDAQFARLAVAAPLE